MRNKIKYIASSLLICTLLLTSCFDDRDMAYSGEDMVEFADAANGGASLFLVSGAGQTIQDTIVVQLIGPQRSTPINVNWSFDAANSTAIEGVHFNFVSASTITIPANSSFGYIVIEGIGDAFGGDPSVVVTMALSIVSSDVGIRENRSSLSHNLSITCPSNIPEGEWTETNNGGEVVTLVHLGDGIYEFSNFNIAYYPPSNNPIRGIFSDVCNTLTLQDATEFGVQWRGEGTYDSDTQTITFPAVEDVTFNPGAFSGPYVFVKN